METENPFAAPQSAGYTRAGSQPSAARIWRSGKLLVVAHQAQLPDRCVKCNASAAGYQKRMKLTWHAPIAYAGLLLGLIPFVLIALVTQKKMTVQAGICAEHLRRRRKAIWLGLLGVCAGIGVMIIGALQDSGWILLFGLLGIVATLVYAAVAARIIWPKKITRELAWIKGVTPEYLVGLPEFPEP